MRYSSECPPVFFPIEVQNRELISKLFLAVDLALKGAPVFLGHKQEIYSLAVQSKIPGILFNKSVGKKNNHWLYETLRGGGSLIMAQDEESGIVFGNYSDFYSRRRSLDDIPFLDHWFCWGNQEYDFLRELHKEADVNLTVSGSPRTVLWGKYGKVFWRNEIESIQAKTRPYALVISNNVLSNSHLPDNLLFLNARNTQGSERIGTVSIGEKIEFEKNCTRLISECIEILLRKTNLDIVIRPHPAESPSFWINKFRGNSRVMTVTKDSISPWILSSEVVIHNGSTAAIESYYADKPLLAVLPQQYELNNVQKSVPYHISGKIIGSSAELNLEFFMEKRSRKNSVFDKVLEEKLSFVGTTLPVNLISSFIKNSLNSTYKSVNFELVVPIWKNLEFPLQEAKRQIRVSKRSAKFDTMDRYKRPPLRKSSLMNYLKRVLTILNSKEDITFVKVSPNSYCLLKR